jgi:hypothetical protein
MEQNAGLVDRVARVFIGIGLFGAAIFLIPVLEPMSLSGLSVLLSIFGLVFIVVGLLGHCPLYSIFGISTKPRKISRVERIENMFRSGQ